jgi:hypothetical protein
MPENSKTQNNDKLNCKGKHNTSVQTWFLIAETNTGIFIKFLYSQSCRVTEAKGLAWNCSPVF